MPLLSKRIVRQGTRIRVLVVDDSAVVRRLVTHAMESDPWLEVVGGASNGSMGLARLPQVNPDVITLDIEMPGMNGIDMLRELRKTYKDVRVIIFSTENSAAATMEALSAGADDYVTKNAKAGSLELSIEALGGELIPKIKQFFTIETERTAPQPTSARPASAPRPHLRPRVVAIGVSTGGPAALGQIIPQFPADFPLPILIVQHMPPVFTRLLAERLQASIKLRVAEATDGMTVESGKILIAPGDYHMRICKAGSQTIVKLDQRPHENSCRPSVDVLFRSVEEVFGGAAISVVLTGMGCDGMRGAEALKSRGACVIAQDEASSVVWGMPGAVANAGLADAVVPLSGIVPEVLRRALT